VLGYSSDSEVKNHEGRAGCHHDIGNWLGGFDSKAVGVNTAALSEILLRSVLLSTCHYVHVHPMYILVIYSVNTQMALDPFKSATL